MFKNILNYVYFDKSVTPAYKSQVTFVLKSMTYSPENMVYKLNIYIYIDPNPT